MPNNIHLQCLTKTAKEINT